jgi:hypothetical protein
MQKLLLENFYIVLIDALFHCFMIDMLIEYNLVFKLAYPSITRASNFHNLIRKMGFILHISL